MGASRPLFLTQIPGRLFLALLPHRPTQAARSFVSQSQVSRPGVLGAETLSNRHTAEPGILLVKVPEQQGSGHRHIVMDGEVSQVLQERRQRRELGGEGTDA